MFCSWLFTVRCVVQCWEDQRRFDGVYSAEESGLEESRTVHVRARGGAGEQVVPNVGQVQRARPVSIPISPV